MIAYLQGKIINSGVGFVVILVSGVGYKVFTSEPLALALSAAGTAEVFVYQQIKEDSQALYGFTTPAELEFFELLLTVSGVGPKSALGIMNSAKLADLQAAMAAGDAGSLRQVAGIGQKTAERLIVELRNKLNWLAPTDGTVIAYGDELEALVSLGYSTAQARQALSKILATSTDSGERIRQALKYLS